ncbi:MAG TPA: hypothetical protein VHY08_28760 [Bacillota bacterium]|nr:hypothetical protein [Bacillota bacterium]
MTEEQYTPIEKLMVKLSFITYLSLSEPIRIMKLLIQDRIKQTLARIQPSPQTLVWGPVIGQYKRDRNVAMMYIAKDNCTGEYTVVVRGTNPFSLVSGWFEDLVVWEKAFWKKLSPGTLAPDAMISEATFNSLGIHLKLRYQGLTFFEFLETQMLKQNITVNFTGHSLGGLLAPTLALWFYENLSPEYRDKIEKIGVFSIGAPSAGDYHFTTYIDQLFKENSLFQGRTFYYRNVYDVTANVWHTEDMKKIAGFFQDYGIPVTNAVKFILSGFLAIVESMEYLEASCEVKDVPPLSKDIMESFDITNIEEVHLRAEFGLAGRGLYAISERIGITRTEDILKTFRWVLMAQLQHVFPYLKILTHADPDYQFLKETVMKSLIQKAFPGKRIRDLLEKI